MAETDWLSKLDPETDIMYVTLDEDTYEVKDFIVSSRAKNGAFLRNGASWFKIPNSDESTLNDVVVVQVSREALNLFDRKAAKNQKITFEEIEKFVIPSDNEAVTAAVEADAGGGSCPPATQDIKLNIENRQTAIDDVGYGPLNPAEPNEEFWQKKADRWSVTIEDAKKSLCGNCAVFVVTTQMKECIRTGLEGPNSNVAYNFSSWDQIDEAADLGYCEALDFKCAASRTCDAWVAGGPITDKVQ
ncbi:high potential iron-sulfur protein [Actinomycetia phage DSL-LC01]|nr:high potential iron-sulfur protein [Actinomycetia phage DSL-LC01]